MAMAKQQVKTIDERFDEVTQAFLDQRDFTTFCFEKLQRELRQELREAIGQSESRLTQRLERSLTQSLTETLTQSLELSLTQTLTHEMDRRFTRNDLLLSEILNEVKALSRWPRGM